ncbi:hypothetical protein HanPI659440_Chr12g0463921 [Helianthus annuus]|nr:hypothetical protein HanPI659440_Chr12g0463921 [Helianthus annuus]
MMSKALFLSSPSPSPNLMHLHQKGSFKNGSFEIIVEPGTSRYVKVLTLVETCLGKDFIPSVLMDGISNPLNKISIFNFPPKALA